MNRNNGNNNPSVAMKVIADAVNETHEWSAFVPFSLSDNPNELNFELIDVLSMVCAQPYEKDLHFQPTCKLSEKSSWKNCLKTCREKHEKIAID